MACFMVNLKAQITPQYDSKGDLVAIDNTTSWRDGRNATSAKRQTQWVIVKNGVIVFDFTMKSNTAVNAISPQSNGDGLVLTSAQNIFDFMDAHNIVVGRLDIVQVYIKVINAKKVKSSWSNPITLPQTGTCTRSFKSFSLKNYVAFNGKCLVPYAATI